MSENEDQSPFGRGFVAACIVIGAILACGGLLIITGLSSDASSAPTPASLPAPAGIDLAAEPAGPAGTAGPATPAGTGGPATPAGTAGSATPGSEDLAGDSGRDGASRCGLAAGDQAIPASAPAVDGWEVTRRVVVPRSAAYGPAKVDADGFRRCFAHSPTGAVFAAYNAIGAIADQRKAVATAGKLMLPGRDTDALIRELRSEPVSDSSDSAQPVAYRVLDASRDRATVMLAMPVETAFVSATLTLAWYDGDWRVVPPPAGEAVGAPFAQRRDLDGFVAWSGI
ncbi:hypothetical protein EV644_103208 [Kribbella orskensis]|uniref:DUF8175 domain-containing protein n=1 Tax=Kribbella orskensis TaxID=2512216 RepID=A0ABY2BQ13_9ACTN|nr:MULTISPECIES: hypothetical protein [Kribbella]TCN39708.1 hypothetical protein EV642_106212 [Kribbella sp. VKM Ac-2500]TCO27509.1 hypothetical protein EV644_103208 [Kribbella orskensis]